MCGINGSFGYGPAAPCVSPVEIECVRDAMATRGPDGVGFWMSQDHRVALAHRRLAIIDPSDKAAQPMRSEDRSLVITFDGAIYNYRELRTQLEARGAVFRTQSDTEVLLHLYRERGTAMVDALRGMFAFAIWDEKRRGIFLARDPFGIKPLYYANDGHSLRFASQAKALVAGGSVDTRPSPPGLVGFYLWGSLPEPYTVYRGIRTLPSGSTLWAEEGAAPLVKRYWSVAHEVGLADEPPQGDAADMRAQLAQALRDSVRHHLVSDVPVGVFLSSGLDSATIAALAQEGTPGPLRAITVGFEEFAGTPRDEVPLAREVARHYGLAHSVDVIKRADMEMELDHIRKAMDQPSVDGINTFFVSRSAARLGMKVALAGIGGDELFGGYATFRQIPAAHSWMSRVPLTAGLGKAFRIVTAPWLGYVTSPKYAGILEYGGTYGGLYMLRRGLFMPWELPRLMDPDMAREGWRALKPIARLDRKVARIHSPRAKVMAMELRNYLRSQLLRDADWAGMAWSLQVRVPLVDVRLFHTVAPWLEKCPPTKRDMAAAPARPLSAALLDRPKSGFSIPVPVWLGETRERGLRGWARLLTRDIDLAR